MDGSDPFTRVSAPIGCTTGLALIVSAYRNKLINQYPFDEEREVGKEFA